ncbi:hypothetical protein ACVWYD_001216 [Morganella morganii]
MNKNKKQSLVSELSRITLYCATIFYGVYYFATEKLDIGSTWYSVSYYFLMVISLFLVFMLFSCYRMALTDINDPVRHWMERGYSVSHTADEYDELFTDFILKYYSSGDVKNRISDAFQTVISILDLAAIVIAGLMYWRLTDQVTITPWSFIPQIFLLLYFIAYLAISGLCRVITNRYPGEARRARIIDPYLLLHP